MGRVCHRIIKIYLKRGRKKIPSRNRLGKAHLEDAKILRDRASPAAFREFCRSKIPWNNRGEIGFSPGSGIRRWGTFPRREDAAAFISGWKNLRESRFFFFPPSFYFQDAPQESSPSILPFKRPGGKKREFGMK